MVLCIIALPIFFILGLFSATHRELAIQSFKCLFTTITLRPCDTGLDTKIKTKIVSSTFKANKRLGKFVFKYFSILSWIFVILMLASTYYTIEGGVNYYLYGNCNGLDSTDFCVFDPTGANSEVSPLEGCAPEQMDASLLKYEVINKSLFETKPGDENEILFIGCYNCKYTREVQADIFALAEKTNSTFIFGHLPIGNEVKIASAYEVCVREQNSEEYWNFVEGLFSEDMPITEQKIKRQAQLLSINQTQLQECIIKDETLYLVDDQVSSLMLSGTYGTPTIYINERPIVGPKPLRVYERLLK